MLAGFMRQIGGEAAESRRESLRRPPRSLAQHRRTTREIRLEDGTGAAETMRRHLATVRDTQLLNW